MVRSVHRISRTINPAFVSTFVPALLLSLVLGAALAYKLSPWGVSMASGAVGGLVPAGTDLTDHHAEPIGTGIVVPGEWRRIAEPSHHMASARPVPEQLAARAADVEFCVGATLEPFDAAWAQLLAIGPGEAAERTRRCLMELVFTHVDSATAGNVRALAPAFGQCYRAAMSLTEPTKGQAMAEVTACLTTLTARPGDD